MIQYHALRKVGDRFEEIRVIRPTTRHADERTEHVAWHDDESEAKQAMRRANGV